ncbi:MAG: hypothetical protein O3C17_04020, partial [Planctomycetota bacterium]|nr:hypothetical protein [Planctomycetota bacterium]
LGQTVCLVPDLLFTPECALALGLQWIAGLEGLRELGLRNCPIGDGFVALAASLGQLAVLKIFGTSLSETAISTLRTLLPDCEIIR